MIPTEGRGNDGDLVSCKFKESALQAHRGLHATECLRVLVYEDHAVHGNSLFLTCGLIDPKLVPIAQLNPWQGGIRCATAADSYRSRFSPDAKEPRPVPVISDPCQGCFVGRVGLEPTTKGL